MQPTAWCSLFLTVGFAAAAAPRRVRINGQQFISTIDSSPIVLSGPNVVVKGPPYLPSVSGTTYCPPDTYNGTRSSFSCTTFNHADAALLKSQGRNSIRLGVVWAGAQPRDSDELDPDFVARLHDVLNLTDREGIHVILDNHGDMVGSAGCGNGVPMWFQKKAAPELIGKQLKTDFPFSLIPSLEVSKVEGYDHCQENASMWAKHAGDPNYNLLNECCLAMNGPNPGGLGYTSISQKTMDFMLGAGRPDFVRFWKLMAEVVVDHPSAFGLELMNEPMSINRRGMYDTWKAVTEAVTPIIPDISVAICDTGEGAVLPSWVTTLADIVHLPYLTPSGDTVSWIQKSENVFYAWHWYGAPKSVDAAIANVQGVMNDWNVPSFATEFMSCDVWNAAAAANISHSYWHYSCYCNTGKDFGNRKVPSETFGACILGWGGGSVDRCM